MFTVHDILGGFLLPAVLVLVGSLGLRWKRAVRPQPEAALSYKWLRWVPAGAFVVGNWQLYGWPGWVPADATRWVMHIALISGVIAMITQPVWLKWLGCLILAGFLPGLLLQPMIHYDWSPPVAVVWVAGYALMILLQMGLLFHASRSTTTSRLFFLLTMIVGATTLILSLSGSLSLGKTCGILATGLLASWLASPWLPKTGVVMAWVPLTAVVTSGLWLCGLYYADLDRFNAGLLYASVPMAWLGLRFKLGRRPRWQQLALPVLLTALPLALAFARALLHFIHNETSGY